MFLDRRDHVGLLVDRLVLVDERDTADLSQRDRQLRG
jgi:hypothetical protein